MPRVSPSFGRGSGRAFIRTALQPDHWDRPLRAAAGGYGAALALWQVRHAAGLEAFIFDNALPIEARRTMLLGLLAGAAAGVLLWAALCLFAARGDGDEPRWDRLARILSLGVVLPLIPIIASPAIRARAPLLALAGLVAGAGLVYLVVRPARSGGADARHGSSEPMAVAPGSPSPDLPPARADRIGLVLTVALALAYAGIMSTLAIARHNAYLTNAFDLGIHDQAIYNILRSGYMRTTLYGPYAIDYIGDHFSPILYLLAPIYALHPDARTLLVLQSFFLAAAAVPLYLLARLKTKSVWIGVALVVAYLLQPALHGVNLDDFHQLALLVVFLLFALYFLEAERPVAFLVCLALALLVKEEVALTVVAVGAYAFFAKRRRGMGAALMLAGLAYFFVVTGLVMPRLGGTPQIDTRFGGFMAPGTHGAGGVAWTLLTNPMYTVVSIFGNAQKTTFLGQVFLPVLFLPLLATPVAWLAALPSLAIQTITNAHTQYDINGHYTAHLLPFIFFLTVLALARIKGTGTRRRAAAAGVLAAVIVVAALGATYAYSRAFREATDWPQGSAHARVVDEFVAQIPRDASVSTLGGIAPHLTARKTVYLFPDVADAEYLLLDTSVGANYWPYEGLKARDKSLASMAKEVRSGVFGLVRSADGVYLFQRGRDPGDSEAIVRRMISTRYEAEDMRSDFPASVAVDNEASGRKARVVSPADRREDGRAAVVYGPYTDLPPGNYRATFVLKATGGPADARVMTVDVFTHKDGYPRAVKEIYGRDLPAQGGYVSFALDFNTSGQPLEDVEFRATYDFTGRVSVDRVDLEYLP